MAAKCRLNVISNNGHTIWFCLIIDASLIGIQSGILNVTSEYLKKIQFQPPTSLKYIAFDNNNFIILIAKLRKCFFEV